MSQRMVADEVVGALQVQLQQSKVWTTSHF